MVDTTPSEQGIFRGQVVVFSHPTTNVPHVKRLICLPGDTVQFVDGRIRLNGSIVDTVADGVFKQEMVVSNSGSFPRCPKLVEEGSVCEIEMLTETN